MNVHEASPHGPNLTRRGFTGLMALLLVGGPSMLLPEPAAAQALLERLGWTPPADADA